MFFFGFRLNYSLWLPVLLQVEMPRSQFHVPDLKLIEEKILTVKDYRAYVTPMKAGSNQADNKWMGTLKCSSMACMKLVEDILYTTTLNGPMISLLRKGKGASPLELLEIETFSLRWKAAVAAKDNEIAAERALDSNKRTRRWRRRRMSVRRLPLAQFKLNLQSTKGGARSACRQLIYNCFMFCCWKNPRIN